MKETIFSHLNNPGELEKLYRKNKAVFKREFGLLYPELKGNALADFWNERLSYETDEINWGTGKELVFVLAASVLAGLIAKIPFLFQVNEEFFYPRNIGFIFVPLLMAYFAWKNHLQATRIAVIAGITLAALVYINLLPKPETDTLILACMHLPLVLWALLGATYTGNNLADYDHRLGFLKYNGDAVVMTTLILISGGIMTGITLALFSLIGLNIEDFYFENVAIFGAAAAPIVATYLTQTNPQLVGKVSPVIARIFSPLVLAMLVVYLMAIVYSRKNPYDDRGFLLLFNALLVGVMSIIFFSVAETAKNAYSRTQMVILLLLSAVTVIVNGIALSAILFRITEWGFTPNRAAVLGSNVLILLNLLLVIVQLFRVVSRKTNPAEVGRAIALYLPVYFIWAVVVTFLFPVLFGFK